MTRRMAREDMSWLERRHAQRFGLGPVYAGVFVLLAAVANALAPIPYGLILTGIWVLVFFLWIVTRLDTAVKIIYGLVCEAVAVGFVAEASWMKQSPLSWALWGFWLGVAVLGLGAGWWSSKLKRAQVHLEDDLRGWQEIARNFGLGNTTRHITNHDAATGRETGFIVWPPGSQTVASVIMRREQLEGGMGLPEGSLRLMRHGRDTNRVDYVSFPDDPLTAAVEWPGPARTDDGEDLSVDVPCEIGLQEDHAPALVPYYIRDINAVFNKLMGGTQGSGKSGGINLHVADLACRSDASQWGFDMKGGMELTPWDAILDNLATDHDQATEMLLALVAVMEYRQNENARAGRKAWPVDPFHPMLYVWLDEIHRLLAAKGERSNADFRLCTEIMVQLNTTGRALGMGHGGATQNPTLEAAATSQYRDRFQQRYCFRTERADHEDYILNGRRPGAHLLPSACPGRVYIQDRDNWTGLPVQMYAVTDSMIEQICEIRAPGLPLDEGSRQAAAAVSPRYAARCAERYGDNAPSAEETAAEPPDREVIEIGTVPAPPERGAKDVSLNAVMAAYNRLHGDAPVPEEAPLLSAQDAMVALLRERGSTGAFANELMSAANRGKSWFHMNKKQWIDDGLLAQPGGHGGVYVLGAAMSSASASST